MQGLVGNVIIAYLNDFAKGKNINDRLSFVWQKLLARYRAMQTPCRLQALTMEMIRRPKKSPKIKYKGAETRGLTPFAMALAADMVEQQDTKVYQTIAACTAAMVDFNVLLDFPKWDVVAGGRPCDRRHRWWIDGR